LAKADLLSFVICLSRRSKRRRINTQPPTLNLFRDADGISRVHGPNENLRSQSKDRHLLSGTRQMATGLERTRKQLLNV
jgi:hypothetical protein